MLLLWLVLFKAETEDELEEIEALQVPVMSHVLNAYYVITASSEFRERERLWEKARHDEAKALENAKKRGEERSDKKWQSVVADKDEVMKIFAANYINYSTFTRNKA
jgi:hypothetical protein